MGAFKQFLVSDITVSPLTVNKGFTLYEDVEKFIGINSTGLFNSQSSLRTGPGSSSYQQLVYKSIKNLYYSNYSTGTLSFGEPAVTASLIRGANSTGDVLVGTTESTGRYENYLQTSLTYGRIFPTGDQERIGVIAVPQEYYGNSIQPKSFSITGVSGSIYDDGEGNLIYEKANKYCGNIFYSHGIAVITVEELPVGAVYGEAIYGVSEYGDRDVNLLTSFILNSQVTCSFSSSITIYETQYKATIDPSEFNFTLNPTLIQDQTTATVLNAITGSEFNPYLTTVGLYNENQELLAVAKLSQPLPTTALTDMTVLITIDR
jgi:hypothetical protein